MKATTVIQHNDTHLWRMVDDTGILQLARYDAPNPSGGYTTDDNARLLMAAARYYEATGDKRYLDLCYRALGFLQYACYNGWFRNFLTYDRKFIEHEGDQDCYGRCIWCLGYVTSRTALPQGLRSAASALLEQAAPSAERVTTLRACAYTILGIACWDHDAQRATLAEHLARVAAHYHENAQPGWFWHETTMMRCHAIIPYALLTGYQKIGGERLLEIALDSLAFLNEVTTRDGLFWPMDCHGWSVRGSDPALYDQQPIEACDTLLCCLKAYEVTGKDSYLERAGGCLDWFLGHNSLSVSMIDPVSGGCCDGVQAGRLNPNQSAESLLCWLVSSLAMEEAYRAQREGQEA